MKTKFLTAVISCAVTLSMTCASAFAYEYTTKLHPGEHGKIANDVVNVTSEINLSNVSEYVTDVDEEYSVTGFVVSGHDINDGGYVANSISASTTADTDYIVRYALTSKLTTYTVNYVDTEGNALLESQTFSGVIGDRMRVSVIYIDGFVPQAANLLKTLSDNEAENVFTFVYTYTGTTTVTPEQQAAANAAAAAGQATNTATTDQAAAAANTAANDGAAANDAETIDEEGTPTTDDTVDLDDVDTPTSTTEKNSTAKTVGIIAGIGAALLAIILFLVSKKKKSAE